MLIAGVLCVCAAVSSAALGFWSLSRRCDGPVLRRALRAVAPTQLAAAIILAAGGVVALAAPPGLAVVAVSVCVAGAVGIVAVGSWQSARYVARWAAVAADCGGNCAACTPSAHRTPAAQTTTPASVFGAVSSG